ncbi:DUF3253 domain-containing protein [Sphingopyxis sp.]|uniref:DUF3253 domain-containing protein n=1 Tax=Sphingopyxis sp. TaxID=1908224 RepID=UPI003D6CA3F9
MCPSEVARAVSTDDDWRSAMPIVHAAIDSLLLEGRVQLSWKGRPLKTRSGPYRINLPARPLASAAQAKRTLRN